MCSFLWTAEISERLGNAAEYLKTAGKVICVDHHISNHGFGDVQFIEPAASSTSELIYLLLDDAELSVSAAKALYMGIAHDTGVFQYSCTSRPYDGNCRKAHGEGL